MKKYDTTITRGTLEDDDIKMLNEIKAYCSNKKTCDGCIFSVDKEKCLRVPLSNYLRSLSIKE